MIQCMILCHKETEQLLIEITTVFSLSVFAFFFSFMYFLSCLQVFSLFVNKRPLGNHIMNEALSFNNWNVYVCIYNLSSLTHSSFFFLYSHMIYKQNIQDYTTGSMEIHSNPVAITNN